MSLGKRILVLLSGDYPDIGLDELQAVLRAYNISFSTKNYGSRVVEVMVRDDLNTVKKALGRMAFLKYAIIKLYDIYLPYISIKYIKETINEIEMLKQFYGKKYAVRIIMLNKRQLRLVLERIIGYVIGEIIKGKVDLNNPEVLFQGIFANNRLFLGVHLCGGQRSFLFSRRAKFRPFFHPCTLHPIIARAMVNLTEVKEGMVVLDPFVGTGSILIEAALMNCYGIGVDISNKMCNGCLMNLKYYNVYSRVHVINGDSFFTPLRGDLKVHAIITDPPYGRLAPLLGRSHKAVVKKLIELASQHLERGRYLCFLTTLSPREIMDEAEKEGLKLSRVHTIPVHNNLCRRLVLCRRL